MLGTRAECPRVQYVPHYGLQMALAVDLAMRLQIDTQGYGSFRVTHLFLPSPTAKIPLKNITIYFSHFAENCDTDFSKWYSDRHPVQFCSSPTRFR
jgi:hypothetical protein